MQLIELQSRGSTWSLDPSDIVLYVSSDNQDWREFEQDYQVRMHSANGLSLVALHLPQSYHKYWKVSYRSSERNKRFVNSMDRLLRVYGRNARTQGRSQAAAKG